MNWSREESWFLHPLSSFIQETRCELNFYSSHVSIIWRKHSTTRASFHSLRASFSSHRRTTSLTEMFRFSVAHFDRSLRVQVPVFATCPKNARNILNTFPSLMKIQILSNECSWWWHYNSRFWRGKILKFGNFRLQGQKNSPFWLQLVAVVTAAGSC